jgi:acyl-CoA synthetase (AMP-forming)/AMP-acid ligase II
VIVKEGFTLEAEEVISFCEGRLARYKWPKQVTFSGDFPRTSLGKVRKGMLMQP